MNADAWIIWLNVISLSVSTLITCIVLPSLRHLRRIRENELRHVEEALKRLERGQNDIRAALEKHIAYHLNQSTTRR